MIAAGCVIPAAGRGERLGGAIPKALRELGGATLLEHSLRAMAACRCVTHVVVAAPHDRVEEFRRITDGVSLSPDVLVVSGGVTRTDSVRRGLASLPAGLDVVLVHDAARPLVPLEVVDSVVSAVVAGAPAVIPVVPIADTVKRVDAAGRVVETLDRTTLRAVQTPQGFTPTVLAEALADVRGEATDDAGYVEALGVPVIVVPGHEESLKVTRPLDLAVAETLLRRRRVGRVL